MVWKDYVMPEEKSTEGDFELLKIKIDQRMENLKFYMSAIEDQNSEEYRKLEDELKIVINKLISLAENKLTKLNKDRSEEMQKLESLK